MVKAFGVLGAFCDRYAAWILVGWLAAAAVLFAVAPSLSEVGSQDTADFLPASAPSQRADRVIAEQFPDDPTRDAAVIVMEREGGLTGEDRRFIARFGQYLDSPETDGVVGRMQSTFSDPDLAPFLQSPDGEAELIVASLAVFVTLVASLTLTPALLRLLGARVFWPRRIDAVRAQATETSPRWERIGALVRRRPLVVLLAGVVALAVPAVALNGYAASFDLVNDLPTPMPVRGSRRWSDTSPAAPSLPCSSSSAPTVGCSTTAASKPSTS